MAKIIKATQHDVRDYHPFERATLEAYVHPSPDDEQDDFPLPSPEEQAEALLAEAQAEAETLLQEAYAEGLRQGQEAGRQEYLEQVRSSAESLKAAHAAIQDVRTEVVNLLDEQMTALTGTIVSRILRREAWADPMAVRRVLRSVLEHLSDRQRLIIRMNPRDLEVLNHEALGCLDDFTGIESKEIIPDEAIEPGGCTVEAGTMYVDAQLDTQLERILDELLDVTCTPPDDA